jgi:hypothetical protein
LSTPSDFPEGLTSPHLTSFHGTVLLAKREVHTSSLMRTNSEQPRLWASYLALSMSVRLSCIDVVPSASDAVLTDLPVTIGRGDEADICIRDTWSSRVHCRLSVRDGQLFMEDLGSSNGMLLNGAKTSDTSLQSGDQITIGITTFRVTYSRLPQSQESAPSDQLLARS